jgi:hypothetical protein
MKKNTPIPFRILLVLALIFTPVSVSQKITTPIPVSKSQTIQANLKGQATILLKGVSRYVTEMSVQLTPVLFSPSNLNLKKLTIKKILKKNVRDNTWSTTIKLTQAVTYKVTFSALKASVPLQEKMIGERRIQLANSAKTFRFDFQAKPIKLSDLANYDQPSLSLNLDAADIDYTLETRYAFATDLQTEIVTVPLKKKPLRVRSLISATRTSFAFLLDSAGIPVAADYISDFKPYLNFTPFNSIIATIASEFTLETKRVFEERFVDLIVTHPQFPMLLKFATDSKYIILNPEMLKSVNAMVQDIIKRYPDNRPLISPTNPSK